MMESMWSTPSSSFSFQRHRRRRQFYWRLARVGLVVAVLAAIAGYAYQVGASKTAAVVGQLRAEIAELQAGNTALSERAATAVQRTYLVLMLLTTLLFSGWVIAYVIVLEPPPIVLDTINNLIARMSRRFATQS